jgi:hypothetical protein
MEMIAVSAIFGCFLWNEFLKTAAFCATGEVVAVTNKCKWRFSANFFFDGVAVFLSDETLQFYEAKNC